jgi:hypothetical protein
MPENLTFWYPDIYAALRGFVSAAGGSIVIGKKLFPNKSEEKAAAWLDDCLNSDRAAKLDPEEFMRLLKLARERGFRPLFDYVGDELDSEFKPIEPKEELAALVPQLAEGMGDVKRLVDRAERVLLRMTREASRDGKDR